MARKVVVTNKDESAPVELPGCKASPQGSTVSVAWCREARGQWCTDKAGNPCNWRKV